MKYLFVTAAILASLGFGVMPLVPVQAQAETNYGLDTANKEAGLPDSGTNGIPTMIGKVLRTVLGFTGTIFFLLVVYAGLMWMTAAGNEERIKKAQQVLIAAVIGLVIVLSAYAITQFIGGALG